MGSMLVVQTLKHLVDRPRPGNPLVRVDHGSFPSGHVAGTAFLVVVVGALIVPAVARRAWWLGSTLLTLAMMWSRTWLHAHWLSDTLAGATTGAGAALLLWWLFAPLLAREGIPPAAPLVEPTPPVRHQGHPQAVDRAAARHARFRESRPSRNRDTSRRP
ncbi:phosphatase PAP2 family protein [Streptomyces sp. KR80]|uniref:phosphatase PAP2 family protein n=1 Tax=Streptomyces sp. KR80 TaxID=3457426 RepID=UPI003FD2F298